MTRSIDITNQHFGRLKVIRRTDKVTKSGDIVWLCRCECGNYREINGYALRNGITQSCGCLRREVSRSRMKHDKVLKVQQGNVKNLKQVSGTSLIAIKKLRKNNRSGVPGVSFDKKTHRWIARLMFRGKYVLNKSYESFAEAVVARQLTVEHYVKPIEDSQKQD